MTDEVCPVLENQESLEPSYSQDIFSLIIEHVDDRRFKFACLSCKQQAAESERRVTPGRWSVSSAWNKHLGDQAAERWLVHFQVLSESSSPACSV